MLQLLPPLDVERDEECVLFLSVFVSHELSNPMFHYRFTYYVIITAIYVLTVLNIIIAVSISVTDNS